MKKIYLSIVFALFATASFSQVKIGLRVAPMLALTNVDGKEFEYAAQDGSVQKLEIKSSGAGLRYVVGPSADIYFGDNYAFSTGAYFTVKRSGLEFVQPLPTAPGGKASNKAVINIQYLQIPVSLKLFTNEIADDLRLYFQLGAMADFRIAEKAIDGEKFLNVDNPTDVPNTSNSFNTSLLIGAGVEWQMGESTALFMGIQYNRGLLNTVANGWSVGKTKVKDHYDIRHDLIGIEVGLMF